MDIKKRLKSWFTTVTADDDNNIKGSRFLKEDEPTEENYRNLLKSVPFFEEQEDRAKSSQQGLTHAATNDEAKSFDEVETATKTKVVQPHQLPELSEETQLISTINNVPEFNDSIVEASIDAGQTKRNSYILRLKSTFIAWLTTNILNRLVPSGGGSGQVLKKNSNTDYDMGWADDELGNQVPDGGVQYNILIKNSAADGDVVWSEDWVLIAGTSAYYRVIGDVIEFKGIIVFENPLVSPIFTLPIELRPPSDTYLHCLGSVIEDAMQMPYGSFFSGMLSFLNSGDVYFSETNVSNEVLDNIPVTRYATYVHLNGVRLVYI